MKPYTLAAVLAVSWIACQPVGAQTTAPASQPSAAAYPALQKLLRELREEVEKLKGENLALKERVEMLDSQNKLLFDENESLKNKNAGQGRDAKATAKTRTDALDKAAARGELIKGMTERQVMTAMAGWQASPDTETATMKVLHFYKPQEGVWRQNCDCFISKQSGELVDFRKYAN